jgi:mercuric reductase
MFFGRKTGKNGTDLVVIGGGSAAFAAAIRAADLGAKVAVCEAGTIGGTCINRGCLPSKNLLHAAELYHSYRHAKFPGVPTGRESASLSDIINQKDQLVEAMRKAKYDDVLAAYPAIQFHPQRAAFVSPHEVALADGQRLRCDRFVIATGASAMRAPLQGLDSVPYLTFQEALDLKEQPRSLLVIGGGFIGLEIGQFFSRLGTKVTVLEMLPKILPPEEDEISAALKRFLEAEGIEIYTGSQVQALRQENGQPVAAVSVNGERRQFRADQLLLAVGFKPNTNNLGLEAAGVKVDKRGAIEVDDELRTSARHIFAAGDCTAKLMLVTTAAYQGMVAADNALQNAREKIDYDTIPHAVFTDPQVASVGLREPDARPRGFKVECKTLHFEHVPKAGAVRDTRGLIKIVADARDYRILGVHICAPQAADLIHLGAVAVRHKLTVGDLIRMVFVYPTLSEAYKLAALSFKKDISKLSCCAV